MALLTWVAVWPTSMFISLILKPTLARNFPHVLAAGVVAGGIVVILGNRRERTRARSEAFDSPESVHRACADLKLFNQEVLRVLLLRSKRSRFITLVQAATKSCTNFCCASPLP